MTFLELTEEQMDFESSSVSILPIPYEKTTSYIKGTNEGPQAILEASNQLEFYDSELRSNPSEVGISVAPSVSFNYKNEEADLKKIYDEALKILKKDKWLLSLGGEHTVTVPLVRAFKDYFQKPFGLIHLDAHFDLRDSYEGTKYNHACILRRCLECTDKTVSIGVRAFSEEEAVYAKKNKISHITDNEFRTRTKSITAQLDELPEDVYLTIDLDFFSPSEFPGLGTPVPGGPDWWSGLDLIHTIFRRKKVHACDIVELCPNNGIRSDFAAALLTYKCIGYKFENQLKKLI